MWHSLASIAFSVYPLAIRALEGHRAELAADFVTVSRARSAHGRRRLDARRFGRPVALAVVRALRVVEAHPAWHTPQESDRAVGGGCPQCVTVRARHEFHVNDAR